jgi:hypothetical protein
MEDYENGTTGNMGQWFEVDSITFGYEILTDIVIIWQTEEEVTVRI